jgi:hypothetical protein
MNYSKVGYKIACWALIIGGAGHFSAELLSPKTPEQLVLIETMEAFTIHALGTETNIFSFHQGFSFMMGLLIFSYGLLNLLILKNSKLAHLPIKILLLNSIVTLICAFLSFKYFFIIPTALTGLAFFGFSYSFFKSKTA